MFQTIIDIVNNPEVENLLEKSGTDLFNVDIDRGIYRKIFFRNPRLFRSLIFTKPSITYEYLDECYNNGIEVTNVLGEDKAFEMMESVKITDTEVFDELDNIIMNNEELSDQIAILKVINLDYDEPPWQLCLILFLMVLAVLLPFVFFSSLSIIFNYGGMHTLAYFFALMEIPFALILSALIIIIFFINCAEIVPPWPPLDYH